jgi:hypothetical protein
VSVGSWFTPCRIHWLDSGFYFQGDDNFEPSSIITETEEDVSMAMSGALSNEEVQAAWTKLAEETRTGVLMTLRNGRP